MWALRGAGSPMEGGEDPQETLRGLNQRLRGFLEHMDELQRANASLQERIVEWGSRNAERSREWSEQERTADQLRAQISRLLIENAELALRADRTKASVSRIQRRCEAEERLRQRMEQQASELRHRKADIDVANTLLEKQLITNRQELELLQNENERELILQQEAALESEDVLAQAAAAGEDGRGMEVPRVSTAYECPLPASPAHAEPGTRIAASSRPGQDAAVPNGGAPAEVRRGDQALREARAELAEVRKRWRGLQVEIESLHAMERGLHSSLRHTQQHYAVQLQDLSRSVLGLEVELDSVRNGLAAQRQQHSHLLNTKMRLEREIATYRKLLEHEEGRFLSMDAPPQKLRPWRSSVTLLQQNGLANGLEEPANHVHALKRQGSHVVFTESLGSQNGEICTVKKQEILEGNVVRESAEGHGRVETEKIDKVIKQWEGSFFKGNPKLRKKSVSLRFDLHMAVADEGCGQTKQDSLPDVEVRLVMKRSRSIPTITQ